MSFGILKVQEKFLRVQAAAETGQAPVCADHAVTGNNDADRVGATRGADGPR
jgi:hypothetical protein